MKTQAVLCDKSATGSRKPSNVHINIIQLNICGLKNKKIELAKLMNNNKIHIALLQETLHKNLDPSISGYTHYPCPCHDCRGIITYLRNDIVGDVIHVPAHNPTDIQKATIWHSNKKYTLFNVYNPPRSTVNLTGLYEPQYNHTLLAGDFNGHSPQWGYQDYNNTGREIEALCNQTNLTVLQDANSPPTLLHRAHLTLSRPDLTIASSDIVNACHVKVLDDIGSDHKPIQTELSLQVEKKSFDQKPKWNFKRAKWDNFKTSLDEHLNKLSTEDSTCVHKLNDAFTTAILTAATAGIPRGSRRNFKPFWNNEIEQAVNARKTARKKLEQDKTIENKVQYNRASAVAKGAIDMAKRKKWADTCANLDLNHHGKKAWALLNNLNNESPKTNPKPMKSTEGTITEDQKKAITFNKYFASVNKKHKRNNDDKERIKYLRRQERAPTANASLFEEDFNMTELLRAMSKLKMRKAPGPDKIHNEMLLHLSPKGKQVLLELINLTWKTGTLPKEWRNAIITPILKKNKPPEDTKSYRPISLTSCVGKIAERMVNNRLYWFLESNGLIDHHQAGFRTGQRTEDQLFRLTQKILDGFQEGKHTVAIFVDLQQAYDRVWRKGLLMKMMNSGIHGKLYSWIKQFLIDRTIQTKINNGISNKENLEEGLPQGSCLSCTLFLIFINDLPDVLQTNKALYADDLALWYTTKYSQLHLIVLKKIWKT